MRVALLYFELFALYYIKSFWNSLLHVVYLVVFKTLAKSG